MKMFYLIFLVGSVLFLFYGAGMVTALPPFTDLPLFTPVEFDMLHRGTFNMSHCSRDFINCWEIVKPDAICSYTDGLGWWGRYYESVCGRMREYCDDVIGDYFDVLAYNHFFKIREQKCEYGGLLRNYDGEWYTRRGAGARLFALVPAPLTAL